MRFFVPKKRFEARRSPVHCDHMRAIWSNGVGTPPNLESSKSRSLMWPLGHQFAESVTHHLVVYGLWGLRFILPPDHPDAYRGGKAHQHQTKSGGNLAWCGGEVRC